MSTHDIDSGDLVLHKESGEHWVVMKVTEDGYLHWAGWPQGRLLVTEFELIRKATPTERDHMRQYVRKDLGIT